MIWPNAAPAFVSLAQGVLAPFDGSHAQADLKAALAAKRAEADAAEQDFKDAAAGRWSEPLRMLWLA